MRYLAGRQSQYAYDYEKENEFAQCHMSILPFLHLKVRLGNYIFNFVASILPKVAIVNINNVLQKEDKELKFPYWFAS